MLFWFLIGLLIGLLIAIRKFYCYGSRMDVSANNDVANAVDQRSDYERVIKGESRRGWQVALPMWHLYKGYANEWPLFCKPIKSISSVEFGDWAPLSSIVLPFYRWADTVRIIQSSLIKPNSRATLLEIVTNSRPYIPQVSMCYLSSHLVLVACHKGLSSRMHIFLVDVANRSSRNFTIEIPDPHEFDASHASLQYISSDPKPRLHIVLGRRSSQTPQDHRLEFIDMKYDCDGFDGPDSLVEPLSSESIEFPVGARRPVAVFYFGGFPIVTMAYDATDPANTDKHLCFSFDHHKRWRLETMTRWLANSRETLEGARIMKAIKAFSDLKPSTAYDWMPNWLSVPFLRPSLDLFAMPGGNEVLGMAGADGILRRVIKTPSMKTSAAMSVFRAHPDMKLFEVEEATGVEISDGIRDDGVKEAVRIVEL